MLGILGINAKQNRLSPSIYSMKTPCRNTQRQGVFALCREYYNTLCFNLGNIPTVNLIQIEAVRLNIAKIFNF